MSNLDLWNAVEKTDPKHTKAITGKSYQGTSPKPHYLVHKATETFGPIGIGWGFNILSERFERFGDSESLHVAAVRFWYVLDGQRGEFEQVGQTRSSYTTAAGKFTVDEDAPKKSVTDALVKCASYLGFAGDIFSGMWDDSKYVENAAAEYIAKEQAEARAAWLEEQALRLEICDSMSELGEAWKAAARAAKIENDPEALTALEPIKDRMKAQLQGATA